MKWLVLLGLGLVALGSGCVRDVSLIESRQVARLEIADLHQEILDGAWRTKEMWSIPPSTRVSIVPHHLVAARPLASLFAGLPRAKTVIVVSPDHFAQGKTMFTTTDASFCLNEGCTEVSANTLVDRLEDVRKVDAPFLKEHGVFTLLPFLRLAQPQAKIVPVIVRIDAKQDSLEQLAQVIAAEMEKDASLQLVASIDMSHYQTQEVADFHDEMTADRLTSLCIDCVNDLEIDSPGSAYVAMRVAQLLKLTDARVQSHTNSLRILKAMVERVSTSHLVMTFSASNQPVMLSQVKTEFWHTLPKIKTEEDRLYRGYDKERVLTSVPFPAFFGIVRGEKVIRVYPFPFDGNRQLMTRKVRTEWIQKNRQVLETWLEKEFGTSTFEMVESE